MGLRAGVPISVRDLLYGLMLPSGNDAALELARAVDGSVPAFVDRMNAKAAELGLRDTQFQNPHGLDGRAHYSSAYDLAMLGRYAMANPEFAAIAASPAWHLAPPSDYDLYNGNSLLARYPGADGIKIGWTNRAGWTLVASAVRDGRRLYVTVLKSADRDGDASALLDWAYASHEWVTITPGTSSLLRLAQRAGVEATVARALSVCV
jgi:D-alanyl-D-alanine carboxypeptidase (penicillin-binding protein 5/6)